MNLKEYELAVLVRMYDREIISEKGYVPVEKIAKKIDWEELSKRYEIKKSLKRVLRKLGAHRLVTNHGKSWTVASLTKFGVDHVRGLRKAEQEKYRT